ncbi:MAG TPA: shikimate kinase [Cyclobacteriaceae bacterium]
MKDRKIFLIGLPGSGKSTLGKQLAQTITWTFIDLDSSIEGEEQKRITEIFKSHGEKYFRNKESEILRMLMLKNDQFIMATGGGTPCFGENMDLMNQYGITIYLDESIDKIATRIKDDSRPLLKNVFNIENRLNELLDSRKQFYEQATYILKSENINVSALLTILEKESC